ncbi:hypothetical protein D1872_294270 [compost metagenome]
MLYMGCEMFAFQAHRIHADMNQNFYAVRCFEPDGMFGSVQRFNNPVKRSIYFAFGRHDGDAFAH